MSQGYGILPYVPYGSSRPYCVENGLAVYDTPETFTVFITLTTEDVIKCAGYVSNNKYYLLFVCDRSSAADYATLQAGGRVYVNTYDSIREVYHGELLLNAIPNLIPLYDSYTSAINHLSKPYSTQTIPVEYHSGGGYAHRQLYNHRHSITLIPRKGVR